LGNAKNADSAKIETCFCHATASSGRSGAIQKSWKCEDKLGDPIALFIGENRGNPIDKLL